MKTPFLGGTYKSLSPVLASQRCINLYPEIVETRQGKEIAGFYRVPGKKPWVNLTYEVNSVTVTAGPVRSNGLVIGTYMYVVAGTGFFRIDVNGDFLLIGSIAGRTGPVSLQQNNNQQILIVDGRHAYGYDTRGVHTLTGKALTLTGGETYGGTPLINNASKVNGAGQTGASLVTDGWPAGITLPSGYSFTLNGVHAFGSTDLAQFHLTAPVTTSGGGAATLAISPAITIGSTVDVAPADNAVITSVGAYLLSDGWTPGITLPKSLHMTFAGCLAFDTVQLKSFALLTPVTVDGSGVALLHVDPSLVPSGANQNVDSAPPDNGPVKVLLLGGEPVTAEDGQTGTSISTAGWTPFTYIPAGLTFTIAGLFTPGSGAVLTFTTTAGALASSTGTATLAITPAINGGTASTFGKIALPFVGAGPVIGSFQDGFFTLNQTGTDVWWQSNLNDVFTWSALNFSSADAKPGILVTLIDLHREMWLIKNNSAEVWINAGQSGFVFQRLQGVAIEQGCAAPYSVCTDNDSVYWLGASERGEGIVWKTAGYQVKRISTHAIEYALRDYPTIADCRGFTYEDAGHLFVVFTFPSGNATWVYDVTTELWAERGEFVHGQWTRDAGSGHTFFNGSHVLGDYRTGRLYKLDPNYTTGLQFLRAWPAFEPGKTPAGRVKFTGLTIDGQTGVGNSVAPGNNPQALLRYSDDDGQTWTSYKQSSMGKKGETTATLRWLRLGSSRSRGVNRVWELTCSEPIFVALLSADMGAEKLL